jgi:FkbM family methyltransferase
MILSNDYKDYIKSGDIIIQIGSYDGIQCEDYGFHEFIFSLRGECHFIEPQFVPFRALKESYRNRKVNCKVNFHNLAIYNTNERTEFYLNKTESSFVRHKNCKSIKVETRTLSKFLEENSIENIDCLFLDVEGVEDVIIHQLFETTSIRPKIIRYEYPHQKDNDKLQQFIFENGYDIIKCKYSNGDKICIKKDGN